MDFEFLIDDKVRKMALEKREKGFFFSDGKNSFEADVQVISANAVSILVGGRSHLIYLARDKGKKYIFVDGQHFIAQEPGEVTKEFHKADERGQEGQLVITAPMPGKVIRVNVAEKDEVRRNQTLAIVEAMKMENEIKASVDGFVKKVYVTAGELVDNEKPLIELEAKK
jgi:biotin carboxyl carrier protein